MTARARRSCVASAERLSGERVTEQEFRLARPTGALDDLQHDLLPLADETGFEIDLRNGACRWSSRSLSRAKFVVSPQRAVAADLAVGADAHLR